MSKKKSAVTPWFTLSDHVLTDNICRPTVPLGVLADKGLINPSKPRILLSTDIKLLISMADVFLGQHLFVYIPAESPYSFEPKICDDMISNALGIEWATTSFKVELCGEIVVKRLFDYEPIPCASTMFFYPLYSYEFVDRGNFFIDK